MSELLRVKLSLDFADKGGKPEPWVCMGIRYKPEGTHASGWAGVCVSLVPVWVPVWVLGVGEEVVASTVNLTVRAPLLLGTSNLLGVQLPL